MTIFGGSEINALGIHDFDLVFDFGSSLSKVGFSGEDTPSHLFPSVIGSILDSSAMDTDSHKPSIMGESQLYNPRAGLELTSPFDAEGLVSDWDAFERLWEHSYDKVSFPFKIEALRVQSADHPVMFIDPSWDNKANREKLCELAFEKFGVSGFYLGRSAVLSA